ncbi:MAG: hypothetical protein CSA22_08445 [Deltaproteobacteria bacterium]|nr:MAG: hypothetical protein CSA22_08445 [Deltaproteobacteria bacterium]
MNLKWVLSLAAGVGISVLTLWLVFRNVPVDDLVRVWGRVRYLWLIPGAVLCWVGFLVRAVRWRIILAPSREVDFLTAYHPLMIGFMLNCVLPGRIGEMARPALFRQKTGLPFSTGLATVAVERVFDLLFMVCALVAVMLFVTPDPDLSFTFHEQTLNSDTLIRLGKRMAQLALVLLAGVSLICWERVRSLLRCFIGGVPRYFGAWESVVRKRVTDPVTLLLEHVASGLELLKQPARLLQCLWLTVLIWCLQAVSWWTVVQGFPGLSLSLADSFAVLIVVCFFIALPAAPGFWGVWEVGGTVAMVWLGVDTVNAAAYTLVNHGVQLFPVILAGLVSVFISGVSLRRATAVGSAA